MSSLKESNIKNCGFYYPDDVINIKGLDRDNLFWFMKYNVEILFNGKKLFILNLMQ